MANLNLKDALDKALKATKQYVDNTVANATPAIITEEDLYSIFDSIDDDIMPDQINEI